MKKTILIATIAAFALFSCSGGAKKEQHDQQIQEQHSDHDGHGHSSEMDSSREMDTTYTGHESSETAEVRYQCPMKCEGDKTYPKPGKCPVCKMDLEKL